ncbi:MAG: anthranilate synthase component I [Candidatus Omnitrophota bacterium]|nr:anthranilate synthase component I [Candidatus Omnitrophota bacterium]
MEIKPTAHDFKKLTKKHNLIVLSAKFYSDWLTPLATYHSIAQYYKSESFLLESVEGQEKVCRFSFLGFSPICTVKSKGYTIYVNNGTKKVFKTQKDPLSELKSIISSYSVAPKESLRFFGGFVGYLGYDAVRFYERIGSPQPDTLNTFDSCFMLPQYLIIFDHVKRDIEILSFVHCPTKQGINARYAREKQNLEKLIARVLVPQRLSSLAFNAKQIRPRSNFTEHSFVRAVNKAKKYIREGEIIQTVLSQRFSLDFKKDSFDAYRYLRILNPSPYMFYFNLGDTQIAGASPEMLVRCDQKKLTTRPIAGTRPRGATEDEDKKLEASLLADPKEKAEHIMLVDLARNDIGKVAVQGTVTVPLFMAVERFSHVMHIVSEVSAGLNPDNDLFSSLVSCFPAGTLSGAPKVRAMQIINELEPEARGLYGGCVGYFSFTNSLDTCIIIRTIVFKDGRAYVQAGAGIVYDSVPHKEYIETVHKAAAQILAVRLAAGQ